jgi:ankyrin repeat protein
MVMKDLCLFPFVLFSAFSVTQAQSIFEALRNGDIEAVKVLVEKAPTILDSRDGDGMTPLHHAARDGNAVLVDYLIEKGAKTDIQNNQGKTPLHLAATFDRKDAVAALVKRGAALETRDPYGRTAFVLCARERGGVGTAKLLLDAGADINARDKFDETALGLAAWRGKREFVDMLLEKGAAVPAPGEQWGQLVSMSASTGLPNLFVRLTKDGPNLASVDAFKNSLLHEAARGGAAEIVDALLGMGFDPSAQDSYGWTPLHYAALDGRVEAVKKLIERGAPLGSRTIAGQSAWNVAKERGMEHVAALLASKGADTSAVQFPLLQGDYLGQKPPTDKPLVFAPGIISSIWGLHSTAVFTPDGNEVYWAPMMSFPGETYSRGGLLMMKRVNGRWTAPKWASFSGPNGLDDVPFFSEDGQTMYFLSRRPLPGESQTGSEKIWYADRIAGGWSEPKPLDPNVNSGDKHWEFSVDREGNVYFAGQGADTRGLGDIYMSRRVDGKYEKPVNVGEPINSSGQETTPFVAPDGSYLLFSRQYDLWVSFRGEGGAWDEPVKLGPDVNSPSIELCPIVTADGKYLFFLSQRGGESHAYWVRADVIEKLRKRDAR